MLKEIPYDQCEEVIRCLPEDSECLDRSWLQYKFCEVLEQLPPDIENKELYVTEVAPKIHVPVDTGGPISDAFTIVGIMAAIFGVAFIFLGLVYAIRDKLR